VILSLLFCFPLGLIGLWTSPKFSKGARIGVTLGWLVLIGIGGANGGASSRSSSGSSKSADSEAAGLPFISEVKANCDKYKSAPNDIKKSAIFTANEETLSTVSLKDVRGVLKSMRTTQGGGELSIRIDVGEVEFKTESLFAAIKKGTPVYDAVTDMTVDQCVVFSAEGLKASSVVEKSKVCDTEYFAKFTSVKPCK
jgi:hypothetical protein